MSKETLLAVTSLPSFYKCEGLNNFITFMIGRRKWDKFSYPAYLDGV